MFFRPSRPNLGRVRPTLKIQNKIFLVIFLVFLFAKKDSHYSKLTPCENRPHRPNI